VAAVLAASILYLASIFRLFDNVFWTVGLGDWVDPYLINFLLEHWYTSAAHLGNPASPPVFFPAGGTLGYSHGLILFAPFYVALRLFFHPFQAYNLLLFLVVEIGVLCLYVIFRRVLGLSFVEAILLTAFFVSSANVMSGVLGVWSQRASVFLIPPIVLLAVASTRIQNNAAHIGLAALAGLLTTLMFTQDFYTAQLALLLVLLGAVAWILIEASTVRHGVARWWVALPSTRARGAAAIAALAGLWAAAVAISGGFSVVIAGQTVASHDWRRPAAVAAVALTALVATTDVLKTRRTLSSHQRWVLAFGAGALTGAVLFLWIYLGVYREHQAFPESELFKELAPGIPYDGIRSFVFALVAAVITWLPWMTLEKKFRLSWLAVAIVSLLVLAIPVRFGNFSIWQAIFEPLPGFSAIRDPKRIIYLYEMALVLAAGCLLSRLRTRHPARILTVVTLAFLLFTEQRRLALDFLRPNTVYDHMIDSPIDVNSACQSFFIAPAPRQYAVRTADPRAAYGIDAMFISVTHSIPTLNGFSAWAPAGWNLTDPEDPRYTGFVNDWITRNGLTGVCALDIEARAMKPYRPLS
jgi:hypothetical protein